MKTPLPTSQVAARRRPAFLPAASGSCRVNTARVRQAACAPHTLTFREPRPPPPRVLTPPPPRASSSQPVPSQAAPSGSSPGSASPFHTSLSQLGLRSCGRDGCSGPWRPARQAPPCPVHCIPLPCGSLPAALGGSLAWHVGEGKSLFARWHQHPLALPHPGPWAPPASHGSSSGSMAVAGLAQREGGRPLPSHLLSPCLEETHSVECSVRVPRSALVGRKLLFGAAPCGCPPAEVWPGPAGGLDGGAQGSSVGGSEAEVAFGDGVLGPGVLSALPVLGLTCSLAHVHVSVRGCGHVERDRVARRPEPRPARPPLAPWARRAGRPRRCPASWEALTDRRRSYCVRLN